MKKTVNRILAAFIVLLLVLAFTPSARAVEPDEFTIVWLTDTQSIAYHDYPGAAESMGKWIAETAEEYNTRYVVHTGDLVDNGGSQRQWDNYDKLYKQFSWKLPYISVAGNHDIKGDNGWDGYLSRPEIERIPEANKYEGGKASFATFTAKGEKFIIVAVGYGVEVESAEWVNSVLDAYSNHVAILITHDYIKAGGPFTRSGKALFEAVVTQSENIRLVLCGHSRGSGFRMDEIDGRTVTTMMYNYQDYSANCGQMRTLVFNTSARTIQITTYSPYTDKYYKDWSIGGWALFTLEDAF